MCKILYSHMFIATTPLISRLLKQPNTNTTNTTSHANGTLEFASPNSEPPNSEAATSLPTSKKTNQTSAIPHKQPSPVPRFEDTPRHLELGSRPCKMAHVESNNCSSEKTVLNLSSQGAIDASIQRGIRRSRRICTSFGSTIPTCT